MSRTGWFLLGSVPSFFFRFFGVRGYPGFAHKSFFLYKANAVEGVNQVIQRLIGKSGMGGAVRHSVVQTAFSRFFFVD